MASMPAEVKPTATTESDDAPHPEATRVEQVSAQLQTANSRGLKDSPLGRLPAKLRNDIFTLAFTLPESEADSMSSFFRNLNSRVEQKSATCSQVSSALNIMATCKQIRSEAEGLFFSLNNIKIDRHGIYGSVEQVERILPLLKRIPRSLGSKPGHVVIPVKCISYTYRGDADLGAQWSAGGLKHLFLTTSQAMRPFQLFLDLDVAFHQWSASEDSARRICDQDTPTTMHDCSRFHLHLQVGLDPKAALSRIDEVVDDKLQFLQQHRLHRLCPVRAMLRQLESGLEEARQYMQDINDFVSEFPDAVITDSDA